MLGFSGWSFNVRFMTHLCHFLHNSLNSNSPYKRVCIQCWEEDSNTSFVGYILLIIKWIQQKNMRIYLSLNKSDPHDRKRMKGTLSCHHTCWVHKDGLHLSRKTKEVCSLVLLSHQNFNPNTLNFLFLLLILDITPFVKEWVSLWRLSKVKENGIVAQITLKVFQHNWCKLKFYMCTLMLKNE